MKLEQEKPEKKYELIPLGKDETTNIPSETVISNYFLDALFINKETFRKFTSWDAIFIDDKARKVYEYHLEHDLFEEIKLDSEEFRVLQALFTMYTKRNFPLEGFMTKWSEFYRACGAEERENNFFAPKEKRRLRAALASLEMKQPSIVYKKFAFLDKTGKPQYYKVMRKEPLCKSMRLDYPLSDSQIEELPLNIRKLYLDSWKNEKKLLFTFFKLNPVIAETLNYFKIVDTDFYRKLKELRKKRNERVTKFDFLFYYWLTKQTREIVEIDKFKLAEAIKLSPITINTKRGYVEEFMKSLYKDFKELRYLLNYELNLPSKIGGKKDRFYLNPEKFPHLKKKSSQKFLP